MNGSEPGPIRSLEREKAGAARIPTGISFFSGLGWSRFCEEEEDGAFYRIQEGDYSDTGTKAGNFGSQKEGLALETWIIICKRLCWFFSQLHAFEHVTRFVIFYFVFLVLVIPGVSFVIGASHVLRFACFYCVHLWSGMRWSVEDLLRHCCILVRNEA